MTHFSVTKRLHWKIYIENEGEENIVEKPSHNPIWFVSSGLRGTHASYSRDHRYFYLMEEMATVLQSENLVHIVNGNCEGSDTLRSGLS